MKVSVLIGSRNRPQVLRRCLDSVYRQDYQDLEVIVLDDCSDDAASYSSLLALYPNLKLIRSEAPCGVAGGRNALIAVASGDILCFIDDDAYFEDGRAIVRFVSIFKQDPDVGIVACKILNHESGKTELFVPFSQRARRSIRHLSDTPGYVSYYLGGCHAIRREVFDRCGMYCQGLMFGEEELDLSYRAIRVGYKVFYEPRIVVHHVPQPSVLPGQAKEGSAARELYFHVRNRFYLAYRYLPLYCIPSYLAIWLTVYAVDAIRLGSVGTFLAGLVDGIKFVRGIKREVLNWDAIRYINRHHGRLWY